MGRLSVDRGPVAYPINYWRMVAMVFFIVSGGPQGIEGIITTGGALVSLVMLIAVSWAWSIPETAITVELSLVFPTNAGFCIWVNTAFGPFWGFFVWYLSFCSNVLFVSVFPILFVDYLASFFYPSLLETGYSGWPKYIAAPAFTVVMAVCASRGLKFVGNLLYWLMLVVLLPFAIMLLWGLPKIDPYKWVSEPQGGFRAVEWVGMLNILFTTTSFWDSISSVSGEVDDINTVFPAALVSSLWIVMLSYIAVLLVAIGVADYTQSEWGSQLVLAQVAGTIGGNWLKQAVYIAVSLATLGSFQANLCMINYQMAGMADKGLLPKIFSDRNDHGTPIYPLVLASALSIGVSQGINSYADATAIIEIANFIFGLTMCILFVGFIKLRISHPEFHRPYTAPVDALGGVLFIIPPLILVGTMWVFASRFTWFISVPLIVLGALLYPVNVLAETAGWAVFDDVDPMLYPWEDEKGLLDIRDKTLGRSHSGGMSRSLADYYYQSTASVVDDSLSPVAKV